MASSRGKNGQSKTHDVRFEKSPNYRHIPVNGVWGSASAQEIHANFFFDRTAFPESITLEESGMEVDRKMGQFAVTRTLEVGISMTPTAARSIAEWLLEKVEESDRVRGTSQ